MNCIEPTAAKKLFFMGGDSIESSVVMVHKVSQAYFDLRLPTPNDLEFQPTLEFLDRVGILPNFHIWKLNVSTFV